MILQALKEYYDRKAADPASDIAPEGWERKEIPFIVVLNKNGDLVQIEDTREVEGKKRRAKIFLVPRSVNRSIDVKANLLWDKAEYLFPGIDVKKDNERFEKQRKAFINKLEKELGDLESVQCLIKLLNNVELTRLSQESCWEDIRKTNPNLSFRFDDETNLICQREDVIEKINRLVKNELAVLYDLRPINAITVN